MRRLIRNAVIWLANVLGLPAICRRLSRKQVVILMYHGLVEDDAPAEWTQLSISKFERQMRHLARFYSPVSLEQAVACLSGKAELPHNPVVVTFDDGYRSNYVLGYPVLDKYGIPATVFISTSLLGHADNPPRKFWFDKVYALAPGLKNGLVDLSHLGLPVFRVSGPPSRLVVVEAICERLKDFGERDRQRIIDELVKTFPVQSTRDDRYRGADWSQVRGARPLIMPGAHTVNHEILSPLAADAAREEISLSKLTIERELSAPVPFFAYPNGRREDFTDETKRLVIEAGFRAALTTIEGLNRVGDDLYELKRIGIGSDSSMIWFRLAVAGFFVYWHKLIEHE
jgi:peptidoglycan/xylan/chitin deacetylase (PgdA/CDA1 family)